MNWPCDVRFPLRMNLPRVFIFAEYSSAQGWNSAGMVGYPSGQRGQTVNLLAYAFDGSNPSPTTTFFHKEKCHFTQYLQWSCQPALFSTPALLCCYFLLDSRPITPKKIIQKSYNDFCWEIARIGQLSGAVRTVSVMRWNGTVRVE